jgi:hypothetical protein
MLNLIRQLLRLGHIAFGLAFAVCTGMLVAGIVIGSRSAEFKDFFRFSHDERWLLTSTGSQLRLYDLENGSLRADSLGFENHPDWDYYSDSLAFFDDRHLVILTTTEDGQYAVVLWDVVDDVIGESFPLEDVPDYCQPTSSANGRVLFLRDYSSEASQLIVWDVEARREIQRVRLPAEVDDEVQLSHDGSVIALKEDSSPRYYHVYSVRDWRLLASRPRPPAGEFLLVPDGKRAVELGTKDTKEIDLESGTEREWNLDLSKLFALYGFSADGGRMLGTDRENHIMWDTLNGAVIAQRPASTGAKISPSGKLAILFYEQQLSVWNVETRVVNVLNQPSPLPDPCSLLCAMISLATVWAIVGAIHLAIRRQSNPPTGAEVVRAELVK